MRDLCITWPKSRPLESYVEELAKAEERGEVINFRVPTLPKEQCERCYVVHDGMIRGYSLVVGGIRAENYTVRDPITEEWWPEGNYIVRHPKWHELEEPIPMKAFMGYRYIERP